MEHIKEFQRIVASYGTFCTIRRTMGADIDSACGQLVVLDNRNNNSKKASETKAAAEEKTSNGVVPDIEDGLPSSNDGVASLDKQPGVKKKPQQSAATCGVE